MLSNALADRVAMIASARFFRVFLDFCRTAKVVVKQGE